MALIDVMLRGISGAGPVLAPMLSALYGVGGRIPDRLRERRMVSVSAGTLAMGLTHGAH